MNVKDQNYFIQQWNDCLREMLYAIADAPTHSAAVHLASQAYQDYKKPLIPTLINHDDLMARFNSIKDPKEQ